MLNALQETQKINSLSVCDNDGTSVIREQNLICVAILRGREDVIIIFYILLKAGVLKDSSFCLKIAELNELLTKHG